MKKQKNTHVLPRHYFYWAFFRPIAMLFGLIMGYKRKSVLKMKKGESYVILSNHQTDIDAIMMATSFTLPFQTLITDSFFSKGLVSKFFKHALGFIPKHKGAVDLRSNLDMMHVIKEGGSICLFPEGNRTYAEFQYNVTKDFARFIRFFKAPVVLFNLHGGTGCFPRFAHKRRKGNFYGEIKRILTLEEMEKMSDEELQKTIMDNLKVFDSDSGELFKSPKRAEYLERMLFVCPKCGKVQTLYSKNEHLYCSNCGLDVTFNENLTLSSEDSSFSFHRLIDWYNYQIRYVRDFVPDENIIFYDERVDLYISRVGKKRKLLYSGPLILNKDTFNFSDKYVFNLKDIISSSPISGTDFGFSTVEENYLIKGSPRFNPLKYMLMFNRLDTKLKETKADIYYTLEEK